VDEEFAFALQLFEIEKRFSIYKAHPRFSIFDAAPMPPYSRWVWHWVVALA